jgi:hypothetical protein
MPLGSSRVTPPLVETCFFVGRFTSSRSHLDEGLALYDPISQRSLVHHVSPSFAYLGNVLFCLGYPDQALERSSAGAGWRQRRLCPYAMRRFSR